MFYRFCNGPARATKNAVYPTVAVVLLVWLASAHDVSATASKSRSVELPYRLVYVQRNLSLDEHVDDLRRVILQSSRLGFNGVVLSGSFDRIGLQGEEYFDRLRRVKAICDENGVELIPLVFSVGYGGGILAHDRNLAAAVPVRGVPFVVEKGRGSLVRDPAVGIANGGFEDGENNRVRSFGFQDGPGRVSFIDGAQRKDGESSLRFENVAGTKRGMGRVMQTVAVRPFRCYKLSLFVKTESLDPPERFQVIVMTKGGRVLMMWRPVLDATSDWRRVSLAFNSLSYRSVQIYAGVWNGPSGRFWIDEMQLSEAGFFGVLHRPGTPIDVRDAGTGRSYGEGQDFETVEHAAVSFDADGEEPLLVVRPEGRVREGDRLLVDYYQALPMKSPSGQTGVCMSEPRVYEILMGVARALHETIAPRCYFLSMDEIRQGGWCRACERRGLSAGEILGDCITRQVKIIRDVNPSAEIFVWSDMLDPNQNARKDYYLFDGDFTGSWNHVPRDLIIACWNHDTRDRSLRHFDGLGFRTIGCGYYDSDSEDAARDWIASLTKTPGACGIMYTTWRDRYEFLETFGSLLARDRQPLPESR